MYRRVMIPLLTTLLCLSGFGCGQEDSGGGLTDSRKPSDADIAKLLVGQWKMERPNKLGVTTISTLNFSKDESFASEMKTNFAVNGKPDPRQPIELSTSGTWKVVDGEVELTVLKMKANTALKGAKEVPYVQKLPVNSVTESTLKLAFKNGAKGDPAENVFNRVNAKN